MTEGKTATPRHRPATTSDAMCGLKASVVGYVRSEDPGEKELVVRYVVRCTCMGVQWSVMKRYSEFVTLHQRLFLLHRMRVLSLESRSHRAIPLRVQNMDAVLQTSSCPSILHIPDLPELPKRAKKWFSRTNSSTEAIEERQHKLDGYLQSVLSFDASFKLADAISNFLMSEADRGSIELLKRHEGPKVHFGKAESFPPAVAGVLLDGTQASPQISLTTIDAQ